MESLPCSSDTEIQFLPSTFFATIFFFSWLYLCFLDPLCVSKSKHASPFFILKSSFFLSLFVSFQYQYLLFSIWLCRGLLSSSFPLAIYFSCTLIFLAFARNVVHNVSVLSTQWGFCICYQIFYSFLCFFGDFETITFCYSVELWSESRYIRQYHCSPCRFFIIACLVCLFFSIASWISVLV